MKLKSLHMYGFKSFADRTAVSYHEGITGVIGPNGSGKSNIIDAIMWVMGEQTSKSLRASDPTDIIFSGSENRKALGFAEVTLVFTNDGHHTPAEYMHLPEISIGRRIHRSGEREYFMNRETCRLRDIVDFLLAIGLGAKSYAIIQQDRRDRIIQASPDDMREILEETAGISVFKVRRKEAQKRLDSTAERLKGLEDIEHELSRQKESLTSQVEKADQKLKYAEDLKSKEIELLKNHVGHYRVLARKSKQEIDASHQELEISGSEANKWEISATALKAEQLDLTRGIKQVEDELSDCKISLTKFKERSENYTNRQEEREKTQIQLKTELKSEQESLVAEEKRKQELGITLENSSKELQKFEDVLETHNSQLEEIEEGLHVNRSKVEEYRSEIRAIENTKNTLCARNENILESSTKLNQSLQKIAAQEKEHKDAKSSIDADKQHLVDEIKKMSSGLEDITKEKNELDVQMREIKTQLTAHSEVRDEAKETLLTVVSHLASLKKLIESSSGLANGPATFKEKFYKKIKGFLFEHVTLHQDDEEILETYLPDFFQSILIENYDEFVDLIDKCEELSISKVNFLVKDLIEPISTDEKLAIAKLSKIKGIYSVGNRIEKLSFKPVKPLLERIFICRDEWILAKAKQATENCANFIFVTERGTVFSGAHQCTFGRTEEQAAKTGLLSQKREYETLTTAHQKAQQTLAEKEGQLRKLTDEYNQFEEKLNKILASLENEKIESLKLSNELEQFHMQAAHHDDNLKRLSIDAQNIIKEIEEEKELFNKNSEEIEKLEAEYKENEQLFKDFEEQYNDKKELKDELGIQIQAIKTERSVTEERLANLRNNYEDISIQIGKLQNKIDSLSSQIENLSTQMTNARNEFKNLTSEIENLQGSTHTHESKLNLLVANEAEKSDEIRTLEQKIKQFKDAASEKQKFVTDKQVELARFEAILETSYKDAKDKFNLRIDNLPEDDSEATHSRSMLEAIIKDLAQKLAELGPVNERALEEFKDVSTRLEFLTTQKLDIETSMTELSASILEIEETTKVRFQSIYEKVNNEFQSLFPILFPGGHGKLHMLNPEDLLTTGVEILVQLPGKKTQSMSLFSGGEKALVAISLIFSLLKTTPAPFCFLDEVDAPLDEANVGRFNAIINKLSEEFQFVIITHNRRTMEVLDTIYGISMAEPGVSRLVSVDLNNVPEHLRKNKASAIKAKKIDVNSEANLV